MKADEMKLIKQHPASIGDIFFKMGDLLNYRYIFFDLLIITTGTASQLLIYYMHFTIRTRAVSNPID